MSVTSINHALELKRKASHVTFHSIRNRTWVTLARQRFDLSQNALANERTAEAKLHQGFIINVLKRVAGDILLAKYADNLASKTKAREP